MNNETSPRFCHAGMHPIIAHVYINTNLMTLSSIFYVFFFYSICLSYSIYILLTQITNYQETLWSPLYYHSLKQNWQLKTDLSS